MSAQGAPQRQVLVLDTDMGTDPDDAVAYMVARRHPAFDLRLAVTAAAEKGGGRFRFMSMLEAALADGRPPPRLFEGLPRPNGTRPHFCCDELLPSSGVGSEQPGAGSLFDAFADALHSLVAEQAPRKVLYCPIGGCSNLAAFLERFPGDAAGLRVVAMLGDAGEGSLERRAEYNVRLDLGAALKVVRWPGLDLTLVPVNTTTASDVLAVRPGLDCKSPLWKTCRRKRLVRFEVLMRGNLRLFVRRMSSVAGPGYGESFMHDPLALATAAGRFRARQVLLATDEAGRMEAVAPDGPRASEAAPARVLYPEDVDYPGFWTWLDALE